MTMSHASAVRRHQHQHQDGAVVVEFAIVFVLFVTLLAGLIQYGTIFAVQQSLSHAAAEATRAAVDVVDETEAQDRAEAVVADQLDWLREEGITVGPDPMAMPCEEAAPATYPAGTDCFVVRVAYDWANHALVPTMFAVATPQTLTARAVIVRD